MEDATNLFDRLVASALAEKSSTPLRPKRTGLVRLKIREKTEVIYLPAVERSLAEIDPAMRARIRACVLGESPWPLFLHGPAGTGKTCAALRLLDHTRGVYYTAARLCSDLIEATHLRLTRRGEGGSVSVFVGNVWQLIAEAWLVVLDEIGAREKVSDHHYETVQRVLDERLNKPLVCVSNLTPESISKIYDDRILSRLCAGTVFECGGKDRRINP